MALESGVPVDWITARWPTIVDLLAAVLDRGGDQASAASPVVPILHGPDFTDAADAIFDLHDRVIVRAILDGFHPAELMSHFSLLDRLVADLIARGAEEPAARAQALQVAVLELGWRLFGPEVLAACRLEGDAALAAIAQLRALQRGLADPPTGPGSGRPIAVFEAPE